MLLLPHTHIPQSREIRISQASLPSLHLFCFPSSSPFLGTSIESVTTGQLDFELIKLLGVHVTVIVFPSPWARRWWREGPASATGVCLPSSCVPLTRPTQHTSSCLSVSLKSKQPCSIVGPTTDANPPASHSRRAVGWNLRIHFRKRSFGDIRRF